MTQAAPQPYPYVDFLPPLDYTHASVDLVTQNLLDLYRTTERDLQRRWALVVNEPSEGRQRARLTDLFASLDRSRADIEVTVRDWLLTTYPGFYAGGMRTMRDSYSTDAPAWTQPHRDAVGLLSVDTFSSLLRPTEYVPAEIKATVRELARQSTAEALLGGKTATQAGKELAQRMADRGIFGVTYSDGKFVRGSTYADMVVRTRTAIAYNAGAINQGVADGVRFFECSDGAGCGLYGHNDGPEADGMIVDAETASLYPISHPACRRSWGPRPDLTPSEVASLDVSPLQSEESQADQAAFDAFYRQENASKGSTVTQAARAFGRQERAARDLRPSRAGRTPRA